MPKGNQWVTITRGQHVYTKRASMLGRIEQNWPQRPATSEEIEAATRVERAAKATAQRVEEFRQRQDYKDADAIRGWLELMTPDRHPLDALSPRQWAELRQALAMALDSKRD